MRAHILDDDSLVVAAAVRVQPASQQLAFWTAASEGPACATDGRGHAQE